MNVENKKNELNREMESDRMECLTEKWNHDMFLPEYSHVKPMYATTK